MKLKIGKNQYLLTNMSIDSGYAQTEKIHDMSLYLGEECKLYNFMSCIYIIGYAVDVTNPNKSILEMCEELRERVQSNIIGPEATRNWNGRFVIICFLDNNMFVWHDCCGLKQVFYTLIDNNLSISSQARYIAQLYNVLQDTNADKYLQQVKSIDKEFSLLLNRTCYYEIYRLLPNHYIDASDKAVKRIDLHFDDKRDEKAVLSAEIIKNSLMGASRIKPLLVTVTAGWDSRLVLSGCYGEVDFSSITLKYNWMEKDHIDIVVADSICKKIGINNTTVLCDEPSNSFFQKYMNHSEEGHIYWTQMAQAIEKNGFADYMLVKGSCNEIIRNSFGILYNWQITPKIICVLYNLPYTEFSVHVINNWLASAKPYCKKNGIRVLDLFYWEHRMGNWLAECLNEADIVGETFTPFNNRCYLEIGLSVDSKLRVPPRYSYINSCINVNDKIKIIDEGFNENRYSARYMFKFFIKNNLHLLYGATLRLRRGKKK